MSIPGTDRPSSAAPPGVDSPRRTGSALPRCQACGDVIGVYELIVLAVPRGCRETSLAAEPDLADSASVCMHRACAVDLDGVARLR